MKVSEIIEQVKNDLIDRSRWESRDEKVVKRRMSWRPSTKTFPYRGAPNFVEPVIDDTARDRTDQEVSMLLNAPHVCHVSPLYNMDSALRSSLEIAFDSYIRFIIKARSRLEEAMDTKNVRGFSIAKQIRRYNELLKKDIPDFEVCDLLDIIVPPDTKEIENAERVVHVLRYTEREFKARAIVKGWVYTEEQLKLVLKKDTSTTTGTPNGGNTHEKTRSITGITTSGDTKYVVVWEVYRYADETDQHDNPTLVSGKKMVQWLFPDVSDASLASRPWKEVDYKVANTPAPMPMGPVGVPSPVMPIPMITTVTGDDRPWPFVQFRFENRSSYYFDSRGIGVLCMDDQIAATQMRNAMATKVDFQSAPLFTNDGSENPQNVTFEPGSVLPKGVSRETPQPMDTSMELMINNHKAQAGRRVGAGGQYNYSTEAGISRKVQKTATEVSSEDNRVVGVSSSSVDRFNEPLTSLFNMIFNDMKRMELKFPVILPGVDQSVGEMDITQVTGPLVLVPAASSKTLNPDVQVSRSIAICDWLKGYGAELPISLRAMVSTVLANYDSRMTMGWVLPESNQEVTDMNLRIQKLEQSVDSLVQGSQQLAQYVQRMGDMLTKMLPPEQGAPQ